MHPSVNGQWLGRVAQWGMNPFFKNKTVPRGAFIIQQGQSGDSIFLIARGRARVIVNSLTGDRQVVTLFAGDFFGEYALLHGTHQNATVVAATPCSLYELKQQDLDSICSRHQTIRVVIEQVDGERIKNTDHSERG